LKITLIDKPSKEFRPKVQVALNRGVSPKDINSFFNHKDEDINKPEAFGYDLLINAVKMLIQAVAANQKAIVIIDSDVDGWTSSALIINYLSKKFPAWTANNLTWRFHSGKQHGLADNIDYILTTDAKLVICPDSATNDTVYIDRMFEYGISTLVLDHHLSDVETSKNAVIINSQYNYPNKYLSGVGVVYQFCRFLDGMQNTTYADELLDLVAIGMMADMMDMRELETKQLIFKGLQEENIKNPLIYGLMNKANYSLNKGDYKPSIYNGLAMTPIGAAFYIIPLLNALSRSGTIEEKKLVFESMLELKAFEMILSNKAGHKLGDMERRVDQALRCCTNVKRRQTTAEEKGMELLIDKAEKMLDNKILLFTLTPGQINPNIAGLVANKLASKYQRPVCVTTMFDEVDECGNATLKYAGSMRGYRATGIDNFKEIAEQSQSCEWVRGHENAAGICIADPEHFLKDMNNILKDISTDITYYVDYMWDEDTIDAEGVLELATLNDFVGTEFSRPQVYVRNVQINSSNFFIMKGNTLKIKTPSNVDILMFNADDETCEAFSEGCVVSFVCTCNENEWNGNISPQLMCIDYEIEDIEEKPVITTSGIEAWGF